MEVTFDWEYPEIFEPVFDWENRYVALTGGRSSGKSWFLAHLIAELLLYKKIDVICAREHQNSISQSNYKLFNNIIKRYNLPYKTQDAKIISKTTGAEIVFIGLSDITADNIKSYEDFGLVWLEEAQKISAKSWETLNPTIRTPGSKIWLTMNPDCPHEKHPIMSELLTMYRDDTLHIHANYDSNPFCSKEMRKQAELTKLHKPDEYKRIWLGIPDDGQSLNVVKGFSSENIKELKYLPNQPLHLTWDFNVDPMSLIVAHKTDDKVFFIDEFVLENTTTQGTIEAFLEKYPNHKADIIINGDASGDNRSTQSERSNYVIIRNALKRHYPNLNIRFDLRGFNPPIKNRVLAFNSKILNYKGEREILFDPKCKWTIYNCENLRYKEGFDKIDVPTYSQVKTAKNLKFLSHPFDAASYLVEFYFPIKFARFENG